ncbi:MAG: ABC transporter permease subunit [Bacteroidales bacterium]|nr:ABC transporter permease subunit [Bacteroidales bacterium]
MEEVLYKSTVSAAFPKNDQQQLLLKFNDFLKHIKTTGLYDEMYHRWIDQPEIPVMPDIETSGKNGILRIGTTGDSFPFNYVKDGETVGFEIELMKRFAAYIDRKPELIICNFGGLLASLSSGKMDVVASGLAVTEERLKQVDFGDAYYASSTGVICHKKHLQNSQSSQSSIQEVDLEKADIAVITGTTSEFFIREHYPNAGIHCFDELLDEVAALQGGKVDYVFTAYSNALNVVKYNPDLKVLPKHYTHEGAALALPKNSDLTEKINQIIRKFKKEGVLDEMINRWMNSKSDGYEIQQIPISENENARVLKIAISSGREPMVFVQNNQIVGMDIELSQRIAYQLGMRVEFVDMKFSALIPALVSGKADMIASNLSATAERAKSVDFSDEYFKNPQVLITRKLEGNAEKELSYSWSDKVKESFYNNIILEKRYLLIFNGLKVTCVITLVSVFLGTLLGALICFLRMRQNRIICTIAKIYIDLFRGIPQVVLLMLMFYVVFASSKISGETVASITFALNFAAYVSEMFRTSIISVGKGQTEAGIAMGFNKVKTFINIVLPQAVQKVLPVFKGEFISLVKMTSIVGYIAVQDLTKAGDIIRSRTFDAFFPLIMIAILYFVLAWILTQLLTLVEIKTAPKRNKKIKIK